MFSSLCFLAIGHVISRLFDYVFVPHKRITSTNEYIIYFLVESPICLWFIIIAMRVLPFTLSITLICFPFGIVQRHCNELHKGKSHAIFCHKLFGRLTCLSIQFVVSTIIRVFFSVTPFCCGL